MPLKHYDPFVSTAEALNAAVNPYVAMLREAQKTGDLPLAFGEELKEYPGHWLEKIANYYQRQTPFKGLIVEIGCHKGKTLVTMAKAHPDIAFLGIDITYKRVVTTAERAKRQGLNNVFSVLANAKALDKLFHAQEISGTVIFFPDPWLKKKRQAKNKLLSAEFTDCLISKTKQGGFLWLKTDHHPYFIDAEMHIEASGFHKFRSTTEECQEILGETYSSTFEEYFTGQGLPFYSGQWLRETIS